jgi:hypothetical protein
MPSKTTKKARRAAPKKGGGPAVEKDDGTRWIVVSEETGRQVYPGNGVMKPEANRLADGLSVPATIMEV